MSLRRFVCEAKDAKRYLKLINSKQNQSKILRDQKLVMWGGRQVTEKKITGCNSWGESQPTLNSIQTVQIKEFQKKKVRLPKLYGK